VNLGIWLAKADRCLRSATILIECDDPDSACNRAYYAMFNAARAALQAVGQDELAMAKTHSGLVAAFGLHLVKTGHIPSELGRALAREALRRQVSDYEGDGVSLAEAQEAIRNANTFVEAIALWIAEVSDS
jgi:uncharacterized protein (UPF0332 family)